VLAPIRIKLGLEKLNFQILRRSYATLAVGERKGTTRDVTVSQGRPSSLTHHPRDSSRAEHPSCLRALLLGAPGSSLSRQVSSWAPVFSAQRWAYRFPLAYALWCELRNSVRRISDLHEKGAANSGLRLENVAEGCRAGSDGYRAHIEGIQNLQKRRPWASLFDELLFLEGLRAGLEFHGRNCISRSQETPSSTSDGACNPIASSRQAQVEGQGKDGEV
jgi:hypothetical protein